MKQTRSAFRASLLVLALTVCAAASAGEVWSTPTKLISVYSLGGLNVLRMEVALPFFDPANCQSEFVDLLLDDPGRSAEEQRQMVDAIQAAFLTSRNIYFLIRNDICSQRTGARGRLAVGVRVHSN